jgi:hypothetical protein
VKKTPQQVALEYAQTSIEGQRGDAPVTTEIIVNIVDQVLALPKVLLAAEEVDRDLLIQNLEERYSVWIGKAIALEQNDDHLAWLIPERKHDWRLWPRYRQMLEKSWSPIAVDSLDETTDEILSRLEDPSRPDAWDRRGLVVGHVQSGKTSNYTGLICKATDAGYKVIIVLAGLHNNLRSQTQMRLDEGFLGYETTPRAEHDATRVNVIGVGDIDPDPAIRPNYITTRDEKGDFSMAVGRKFGIAPGGKPLLFVVKKNASVLKNLLKWIDGILNGRTCLNDVPLLVIDDEADHASVDTKAEAVDEDGTPNGDHDPSRINGQIRLLLRKFQKSAYVGYTATPFANIFIHDQGRTDKLGDDLFPRSFIINLPAPSNYDGPVRIFGLEPTKNSDGVPPLPLIRTIRDHAASLNPDETSGWMPPKHRNGFIPRYDGSDELPPSLKEAILAFVLACAARRARGQQKVHNSMLVHVTRFTSVQLLVRNQIEREVKAIRNRVRLGKGSGVLDDLQTLWNSDFSTTSEQVHELHPERASKQLAWEQVEPHVQNVLESIHVRTINGTAGDILDYETHRDTGFNVIAVGGDKLARGLTLEGLSVSYFLRASRMYDTLMQMGRWFGFRPSYLDLCRLYTTPELNEWFVHITQAAEELRREFDHMHIINGTPKDYGLKVRAHPTMLVTSRVKMRSATEVEIDFAGAVQETIIFHRDTRVIRANYDATTSLLDAMGQPIERDPARDRNGASPEVWKGARLWSGVQGTDIASFLREYRTHEASYQVNSKMLAEFIDGQLEHNELTDWTVVLLTGDGAPFRISDQMSASVQRRENERFHSKELQRRQGRYLIRRLLSPRDEAIDLDANAYDEALRRAIAAWHQDAGRSRRKDPPVEPSGPAIRSVRGDNAKNGLLLLYPLDPALPEIDCDVPIFGFGISFPASSSSEPVKYMVDNIYWEQEYGAGAW